MVLGVDSGVALTSFFAGVLFSVAVPKTPCLVLDGVVLALGDFVTVLKELLGAVFEKLGLFGLMGVVFVG